MSYSVMSHRLAWPVGTVLSADDLEGCNIDALLQGGHLAAAEMPSEQTPDSPRYKSKAKPVTPASENDTADEPEEQE
jgi:ribosomal protein L12E/L44/L45/RPP1/RPP2